MHSDGRGRPRLERSRRPGKTAREEILDAAAELFTTHGYANTSTRRIADAVGVRQASLYHHFATKDDILDALLAGTVDEPLRLAAELLEENGAATARLHALVVADVAQLCRSTWNLGALYLLPELRVDRFERVPAGPRRTTRSVPPAGRCRHRRVPRSRRTRRTCRSGSSNR